MSADLPETPLTPCVKLCAIHPEAGLCVGCYRSRDEIARWGGMDNAERARIMASLPARKPLVEARRGGRKGRAGRIGTGA